MQRGAFVGVRDAEQRAFGEQRRGELQAHRHRARAVLRHGGAARHRQRRQPGERAGDRVVVHQVHRHGIALRVEAERRRRRRGRRDRVAALERAREVLGDPRARLLRLQIIGVVIAGRQRVRADQDAPLHLGPEPRRAGALVHLADVRAVDAQAVADAVEAREVRRALGRRDQIVRRQTVVRRRQRHLDQLGPEPLEVGVRRFVARAARRRRACPARTP